LLLGAALLAGCASAGPVAQEPVREAWVASEDSSSFVRQSDGSWVELAPNGLARFRFSHERDEGDVSIMLDETRNVRLRLDPAAMTLTEDGPNGWRPLYVLTRVERGWADALAVGGNLSDGVRRLWLEGGGAFLRTDEGWLRISEVDGLSTGAAMAETSRDADTIDVGDSVRIRLDVGVVEFGDTGALNVRAVDRH
jgi:hypothetical protein